MFMLVTMRNFHASKSDAVPARFIVASTSHDAVDAASPLGA